MAWPVLPQEVFDEIISQLTGETSTLKSCSLVCRSFRRNAQKMLFNYTIVELAYDDSNTYTPHVACYIGPLELPINLVLIVKHAPHLIQYIQELGISCLRGLRSTNINGAADLANALGVFSRKGEFPINLRSLSVRLDDLFWAHMDSWVQDALVLLMSTDSLRYIALDGILECPAELFQNLPLLKHLSLITTNLWSLPTTQKELPKLESLAIYFPPTEAPWILDQFSNNLECIANTTQLKTFEGGSCTPSIMPVIEQILRPTSNSLEYLTLREFYITDKDSISINLNRFSRLTDITIYQNFDSGISPMFILITKTMKSISHRNVIRNLSFHLDLFGISILDFESATKDVWQEMDTIWSIPQLVSSESSWNNV